MTKFIPGVHPTFEQQRQKIVDAYFRDEIKPYKCNFCFCGTLHGNDGWVLSTADATYSYSEYKDMENALLNPICFSNYEETLFIGMSDALDVLKSIHEQAGEVIDEAIPKFQKRELKPA